MKKLICAKDMEDYILKGEKVFYVDSDTIVTPSAKDIAKKNNIEISKASVKKENKEAIKLDAFNTSGDNLDTDAMLRLFKTMMNKGLLEEMLNCLKESSLPYQCEKAANGLKVIRGDSVKMDYFDTGDSKVKAYYQELVNKEESKMSAGFLTIEESSFEWELTYEEIDYVIEGTLNITIDGKTYTANAGDVLFVPSGSKVVWGSPNKAKLFYATYPANWADLL